MWSKIDIWTDDKKKVKAQAPVIISASRSTDIPAFYPDWFLHRLKQGYLVWKNPFNDVNSYIAFEKTRVIVFWSKNPLPIIEYLDEISNIIPNYYFQFTLNDYDKEQLEPRVPPAEKRINTFIKLSEKIGKEKVIWRFDPLILTNTIGVNELLRKVQRIGDRLKGYTNKLVFSFADIKVYKKVQNNLRKHAIKYSEFNERLMNEFASGLKELNRNWNFEMATCAEKISLEKYGIQHNKCIDDDLLVKLFPFDKELMKFLGVEIAEPDIFNQTQQIGKPKYKKDPGQRLMCGCMVSKDIGMYNTCPHLCEYCYANTSKEIAIRNYQAHKLNPNSETIIGK